MELVLFVLIRLVAPLLILRWPVAGVILSSIADGYDYGAICSSVGQHDYQYVDKLLDTYFLAIAVYVALTWKELAAKRVAVALFVYRVIGVVLFFATGKEYLLFIFSNIFLDFFLLYSIFKFFAPKAALIRGKRDIVIVLGVLAIPKLVSEYQLHVYRVVPLDVSDLLKGFYSCSTAVQLSVYVALPTGYLLWRIWKARGAKQR